MKRQITLLVAATTSIVLLAFLLPAAALVSRVAEARALDAAQAQVQFLTPGVGLDGPDEVAASLIGTANDVRTGVRWTDGTWFGDPQAPDVAAPTGPAEVRSDDGFLLLQPITRAGGPALIEVFVPGRRPARRGDPDLAGLGGLGVVLLPLALLVADRLVRSMTRPVTELASDEGRGMDIGRPATALPVRVPAGDLAAAVDALLGNVFAHSPEGTGLRVDVRPREGCGAGVTVADDGPGIPEGAVERGRSGVGSTGLGLDIARRTAEASGGSMRVDSSPRGTTVTPGLGPAR